MMKIINNMGPIIEPCGTPLKTSFHCESFPATFTHCFLFFKKYFIHSSISPVNPRLSILMINLSWATEPNAFAKSVYITSNDSSFSIIFVQPSRHNSSWVMQFLAGTNPCCSPANKLHL